LLLEPGGRTRHWAEGDLCQALAREGSAVCAFDVRGIGDLAPEVGRGNPRYASPHAGEEAYAWASLILGRPLLGQRVEDILAVSQAIPAAFVPGRDVILAASGHMTTPALCAAALEATVGTVYLAQGLVSWSDILERDSYREPFSSFLPGVLRVTDLPFVSRLVRPRRLILGGPVDAQGQKVPADAVQAMYGGDVEVRAEAAWNVEVLRTL
jgi:hypothetical protein